MYLFCFFLSVKTDHRLPMFETSRPKYNTSDSGVRFVYSLTSCIVVLTHCVTTITSLLYSVIENNKNMACKFLTCHIMPDVHLTVCNNFEAWHQFASSIDAAPNVAK